MRTRRDTLAGMPPASGVELHEAPREAKVKRTLPAPPRLEEWPAAPAPAHPVNKAANEALVLIPPPAPPAHDYVDETIGEFAIRGFAQSRAVLSEAVTWRWDGIIGDAHSAELVGASYSGKTTLATLVGVAAANPTDVPVKVLGRDVVPLPPGKLLLVVNEENGKQSACAKIDSAIEMLGLPLEATWERIVLFSRAGVRAREVEDGERPRRLDAWSAIHAMANRGQVGLTILDTRARIFAGFGNPNDEVPQAMASQAITRLVEASGGAVIVISHAKKGASEGIEDVSGSAQRGAGADVIVMVSADRKDGRVLSSKVRFIKLRDGDGGDAHPEPVNFSVAKDAAGKWRLAMNASAAPDDQPAHERIAALLTRSGPKTKHAIRKELKMNGERVEQGLSVLFAERRIAKRSTFKNGRTFPIFEMKAREMKSVAEGLFTNANAPAEEGDLDEDVPY